MLHTIRNIIQNHSHLLLLYFFYALCIVYVLALICFKIHSPFWFHQPVYHSYEIYPRIRFSKEPYVKNKRPPREGIFCDTKHIVTSTVSDITPECWAKIVYLLQGHYMDGNFILNHISVPMIQKRLYGESYISCYWEDRLVEMPKGTWKEKLDVENLYGFIGSCPKVLHFSKISENHWNILEWNWMCIHEKYKSKMLMRKMIQTHILQHRLKDPGFSGVYLFSKNTELCKGIVPLLKYSIYTFVLRDTPIHKLPRNYSIRCLNKNHLDLWRAIYVQMVAQYEVAVLPDMAYTLEWMNNERYNIYATVYRIDKVEHVHGVYVLENTCVSWEDESLTKPHMVRLAASMNFGKVHNHDPRQVLFFRGFVNCLQEFLLDKKEFGILEIPCVSDNDILLAKWQEKYELRNVTESAYYLYNMVYPRSPILGSEFICL